MRLIGLKKLVKDIKDAYIEASQDSEIVTYGNIADKVRNMRGSSGIEPLDHTVTFKADGQDYQIITVKDGQSVSAPSPNPTSASGSFIGWLNGETSVTFPLTPTEDVEVNADFKTARTEMEWDTNGDWLTDSYYSTPQVHKKVNNEKTVMASVYIGHSYPYYYVMLGSTSTSVKSNSTTFHRIGTYEYDGKTWHYNIFSKPEHTIANVVDKSVRLDLPNSYYEQIDNIVKGVLDHYFMKD